MSGEETGVQEPVKEPHRPFARPVDSRSRTVDAGSSPEPPSAPSAVAIEIEPLVFQPSAYPTDPPFGAVVSGVTVKAAEADRPALSVAVTLWAPPRRR